MNWQEKLTSRKFWMSVVGFISLLLTTLGFREDSAATFSGLVMAGAVVIAYIVGEGMTDRARIETREGLTLNDVADIVDFMLEAYETHDEAETRDPLDEEVDAIYNERVEDGDIADLYGDDTDKPPEEHDQDTEEG